MCCKGRVVTAAVLGMKNKRDVKDFCLQLGKFLIRAQQAQNVLRSRKRRRRIVNIQAFASYIMPVGVIRVHREQREIRNKLNTLAEYVGNT